MESYDEGIFQFVQTNLHNDHALGQYVMWRMFYFPHRQYIAQSFVYRYEGGAKTQILVDKEKCIPLGIYRHWYVSICRTHFKLPVYETF
jgi:hypothetical protein